jgi:hypothetical protein
MGVEANQLNEIFEERARYLVNLDEIIFKTLGEATAVDNKLGADDSVNGETDLIKKIKVVDQHFESKDFRTFIEIASPEQLSKRKIQPLSPKKLNEEDLSAAEEA